LFERGFECPENRNCFDHKCYPRWYGEGCDGGGCPPDSECLPAPWLSYVDISTVLDNAGITVPFGEEILSEPTGAYEALDEILPPLNGSICVPLDKSTYPDEALGNCNHCGTVRVNHDWKTHNDGGTAGYVHGQTGPYWIGDPCTFNLPEWGGHWEEGGCMDYTTGECKACPNLCRGCGPCACEVNDDCEDEDMCCLDFLCKQCPCDDVTRPCEDGQCCIDERCVDCPCEFDTDCEDGQCCINEECITCPVVCESGEDCWDLGLCCNDIYEGEGICGECHIICDTNTDCPYGMCCNFNLETNEFICGDCLCTVDFEDQCDCLGMMYEYECCIQADGNGCWFEENEEEEGCGMCDCPE
jgi:hypothetical protein